MYKPLSLFMTMLLLVSCSINHPAAGSMYMDESRQRKYKAESEAVYDRYGYGESFSMEDVDVVGWLDNPSAVFELESNESHAIAAPAAEAATQAPRLNVKSSEGVRGEKRATSTKPPTALASVNLSFHQDLEGLVKKKIGQTAQQIQSLRVLGETGQLRLEPKWPGVAPLQSDTLLFELGAQLIRSTEGHRSYKVPAGQLDSAMKLISTLGEVRHERIVGEDLSLAMGGVERRLSQLKLLEKKYKELLTKVKEDEKARVLKLLEDVVQDIQVLTQRQKFLQEQSQWATLDVYFNSISQRSYHSDPFALYWIKEIVPWGIYLRNGHEAIELDLPSPFIEVDVDDEGWTNRVWRATEGAGSSVRAWEDEYIPIADETFWDQALQTNLKKRYGIVSCEVKGTSTKWNWCEFRVNEQDPRWGYLAMKPRLESSDEAKVVQIDFPNEETKSIYLEAWQKSVKKEMEE